MTWTQRLVVLVLGLGLLGLTLHLVRRRRLRDAYAVLWVVTSVLILVLGLVPGIVFTAADWLDVHHSVLMLLIVFVFLAAIAVHYSVVLSGHEEREKGLSEEAALLKDELEKLRGDLRESPPAPAEPKPKPPSLRT